MYVVVIISQYKHAKMLSAKIRNLHAKRLVGWSWLEHSNAARLCVPVAGGNAASWRLSSPSRQQSLDPY